jgi:hypothetical protein
MASSLFGSTVEVPTHSLQVEAEDDTVWARYLHRDLSRTIKKITVHEGVASPAEREAC